MCVVVFQTLLLLLLAMPEALSGCAVVDVPVGSALLSLPFYLLCLLCSALHVAICTSAGASCYFCGLPWALVFAVIACSAALLSALGTMVFRRLALGSKSPTKVMNRLHPNTHNIEATNQEKTRLHTNIQNLTSNTPT